MFSLFLLLASIHHCHLVCLFMPKIHTIFVPFVWLCWNGKMCVLVWALSGHTWYGKSFAVKHSVPVCTFSCIWLYCDFLYADPYPARAEWLFHYINAHTHTHTHPSPSFVCPNSGAPLQSVGSCINLYHEPFQSSTVYTVYLNKRSVATYGSTATEFMCVRAMSCILTLSFLTQNPIYSIVWERKQHPTQNKIKMRKRERNIKGNNINQCSHTFTYLQNDRAIRSHKPTRTKKTTKNMNNKKKSHKQQQTVQLK